MANSFLQGLLGGMQPLGMNLSDMFQRRRTQIEEQNLESKRRLREKIGLASQSDDPELIEATAKETDDPFYQRLLGGKAKAVRTAKEQAYVTRERAEIERARKEYMETGMFTPSTDPNTAFLIQEAAERTWKPERDRLMGEHQRGQRIAGIKEAGGRLWNVGDPDHPVALTPEKTGTENKPRIITVPGGMPRYEDGSPVFPGLENNEQLREQFEKIRSGVKAVPFLEKSGELERTYDAFKASIASLKSNGYRKSPGQDIAIANFFQRFIDPATVREGDIALQRSATSMLQQLEIYLRRTTEGGLIPVELVKSMDQTVESAMQSHRRKAQEFANAYLDPLEKVGYDKRAVSAVRETLGSLLREGGKGTGAVGEMDAKRQRFETLRRQADQSNGELPTAEAQEYERLGQELGAF